MNRANSHGTIGLIASGRRRFARHNRTKTNFQQLMTTSPVIVTGSVDIVFTRTIAGKLPRCKSISHCGLFRERHSVLGLHLRRFHLESSALPRAAEPSMITCGLGRMSRRSPPAARVPRAERHYLISFCRGSADPFNYPHSWLVLFAFSANTKKRSWRSPVSF